MIILQLVGGLGNQLFELAFAERLRQLNDTTLYLDITAYQNYPDRQYDLGCFALEYPFATPEQLRRFYPAAGRKQQLQKWWATTLKGKPFF